MCSHWLQYLGGAQVYFVPNWEWSPRCRVFQEKAHPMVPVIIYYQQWFLLGAQSLLWLTKCYQEGISIYQGDFTKTSIIHMRRKNNWSHDSMCIRNFNSNQVKVAISCGTSFSKRKMLPSLTSEILKGMSPSRELWIELSDSFGGDKVITIVQLLFAATKFCDFVCYAVEQQPILIIVQNLVWTFKNWRKQESIKQV